MPGISKGHDYSRATEPGNQVAATSPHVSVGRDQDDLRPASRQGMPVTCSSTALMSVPHVFRIGALVRSWPLSSDTTVEKAKILSSPALEGLAARGREIGQAGGHRPADIQVEMHDRNPQRPGPLLR